MNHPSYPETARIPVTELRFGVEIVDPYRWLEGDIRTDAAVQDWVARQVRFTADALRALPSRDAIGERLRSVWAYERASCPVRRGGRYFYEHNSGLQNHNVVVMRDGETGAPTVLVDPNAMDADGGEVVRDWTPTRDGTRLAYTVQHHGGDWRVLHFMDVDANGGRPIADELHGLKGPFFAWAADGHSVYYTRFDEPANRSDPTIRSAVYRHGLGEAQADDERVFDGDPTAALLYVPRVSDDGRWLVIVANDASGSRAGVSVKDLTRTDVGFVPLVVGLQHRWSYLGGDGGALFFVTDLDAPRSRVVTLDPNGTDAQTPVGVVAEAQTLRTAVLAGDEIVVQYQDGLVTSLQRFARDGRPAGSAPLPPFSFVDQLRGDVDGAEFYFRSSSMAEAPTVRRCELASGEVSTFLAPRTAWNADDYVIRQIVATSADGTSIPVTLAHARSLDLGTPRPTIMIAYGGFGISPDLTFWETRFGWMHMGGIVAVAHVRGGAEFGADWAAAARKGGRLKTIEDYLAAAQALDDQGIASPRTLVAMGSSNGGILVAAATNAKPDAFAAVLCRVPVTDMLRYTHFTFGKLWIDELGDPDVQEEFEMLRSYSPLHNVQAGRAYPPVIVTTADADDRVVPAHSFKYTATLQNADIGPGPHLVRIEERAGHGEGKPAGQLIEEFTDLWTFAAAHAGLDLRSLSSRPSPLTPAAAA